jgi:tRNA pseudouridine55 synthase
VLASGVLLVDKPAGITSARALAIAKRALGAAKAGHTGTLDPFATGLLPLVFGEATKFSRFLIDADKAYEATLRLGIETTTADPEGAIVRTSPQRPGSEEIDRVLDHFCGIGTQVPPMHSAVRIQGRRLYDYARSGREVERTPRAVEISTLKRLASDSDRLRLAVRCSKGTYIRVLAEDIGEALGCGAYLEALRRTGVGPFRIGEATPLDRIQEEGPAAAGRLLATEVLVQGLVRRDADEAEAVRFSHGQGIRAHDDGVAEVAVFDPRGRFLGVGRSAAGAIAPLRLMSP